MGREIKFRAWSESKTRMFSPEEMGRDQVALLPDGSGFWNIHGGSTALSANLKSLIPMQYTGITDKNGVEVFESDVIEYSAGTIIGEIRDVVAWSPFDRMAGYQVKSPYIDLFDQESIEVIGNIYENPSLIDRHQGE